MTQAGGAKDDKLSQANFIGILALVLAGVAVLSALVVLLAAMNAG